MTATLIAEQTPTPANTDAQDILQDVFGYQSFRDGQQEVIDLAVEGKDSLVIMPTGR